jgi:hypothetical protein
MTPKKKRRNPGTPNEDGLSFGRVDIVGLTFVPNPRVTTGGQLRKNGRARQTGHCSAGQPVIVGAMVKRSSRAGPNKDAAHRLRSSLGYGDRIRIDTRREGFEHQVQSDSVLRALESDAQLNSKQGAGQRSAGPHDRDRSS